MESGSNHTDRYRQQQPEQLHSRSYVQLEEFPEELEQLKQLHSRSYIQLEELDEYPNVQPKEPDELPDAQQEQPDELPDAQPEQTEAYKRQQTFAGTKTLEAIVTLEWQMFRDVNSAHGSFARASCQNDPDTFKIMRQSQFAAWSEAAASSYLTDLRLAKASGRNLVAEKYIRMMQIDSPQDAQTLSRYLPDTNSSAYALALKINNLMHAQTMALRSEYPALANRGRPLANNAVADVGSVTRDACAIAQDTGNAAHGTGSATQHTSSAAQYAGSATQDTSGKKAVSINTYQQGELLTYSERTLKLLLEHITNLQSDGTSIVNLIMLNQVQSYGYQTLAEADFILRSAPLPNAVAYPNKQVNRDINVDEYASDCKSQVAAGRQNIESFDSC